jgi:hypothetical protein
MTRSFALCLSFATSSLIWAAELPKNDEEESFEIEPPLLIPNRDLEKPADAAKSNAPVVVDIEKLERNLDRAKRNASGADHLYRIGVISKMEAEQRALRVVRLAADLENARLMQAKEDLAEQQAHVTGAEASKDELSETERSLARAIEAAHAAKAKREQAELEAAEINLRRQQKLLALGSGRKSEVAKAEQKLAELKAPKEN